MLPKSPGAFDRPTVLQRIAERTEPFDLVVIGGGATGASVALDAASRGYEVVLLEKHDFGKGTSSRSTKLIHGGVRYLAQLNLSLVRDALHERTRLRTNAPHVVQEMSFIVPCKSRLQKWWYGFGFKVYDWLAGPSGFRRSRAITQKECLQLIPTLEPTQVVGGILYSDGQFDDARLLLNILQTAAEQGANVVNYARVDELHKNAEDKIESLAFTDMESGQQFQVRGRSFINATGPFCDAVRKLDQVTAEPVIAPSQGVHVVLDRSFLPGKTAVIVPKTSDGRVIFMIPWCDHVLVGTTDTPIPKAELEPVAQDDEIEFLLKTAGQYLTKQPQHEDILSVFTGIRPLVRQGGTKASGKKGSGTKGTAQLSRDHSILVSESGLITITGGKWTTARHMGEDCVNRAIQVAGLPSRETQTIDMALHGSTAKTPTRNEYGTDADLVDQLAASNAELARPIVEGYPMRGAEVVWAVRHEMARNVEDVLARRQRLLFLNSSAAVQAAPRVAKLMASELGRDTRWEDEQVASFRQLAAAYQVRNAVSN